MNLVIYAVLGVLTGALAGYLINQGLTEMRIAASQRSFLDREARGLAVGDDYLRQLVKIARQEYEGVDNPEVWEAIHRTETYLAQGERAGR